MNNYFKNKLNDFDPLTLTELNASASFLKRIDTKFLLTKNEFSNILDDLLKDFRVLEIAWKRIFSYDNVYMDTQDYFFYNQHQNKETSRTKIRTRLYEDSNLAFFEYKQKENWITRKYRYEFPADEHWIMTKWKTRFFEWVWQSVYNGQKAPELTPAIKTKYRRITFVSKVWEERLTIDFDIKTINLREKWKKEIDLKNLVIIESKSLSKNCNSLKIIKNHWIKQAKSCSKYSLWVIYSGLARKFDTFAETMMKIKEIRLETLKNRFRKTSLVSITKQNIKIVNEKHEVLKK